VFESTAVRWVIAAVVVLAIVGLIAYARGEPGAFGRSPDPEHASAAVLVHDIASDRGQV
jgi:hypothetical protein